MTHKAKPGTKAISVEISPEMRAEVLTLTGERTLTAAIHEALADYLLTKRETVATKDRRNKERAWVAERSYGLLRGNVENRPSHLGDIGEVQRDQ